MEQECLQKTIAALKQEVESLKRRTSFFSSLIDMSVILTSTFNMDELIRRVLEISQQVMNSEASNVMLLDEEQGILECRVALGKVGKRLEQSFTLQVGQGIAGWVAKHQKAVVVPDVTKDQRFYSGTDQETGFVSKSIICAPLISQGKLLGVAEVVNRLDGKSFTGEDLKFFEIFCRGVAVGVSNAQMHKLLLNNQKVEQQLEMASAIQQGFLPRTFALKEDKKYEIAAVNLPASMVGGDLYDCIELRPGLLGVTIGDVSGKGVPAALYMARLISDFRFQAHQAEDPEPTMKILNEMLTERGQQGMFVTMIYLTLDTHHGELSYVNGGHISPILFRRYNDEMIKLDGGKGIPLGIMKSFKYKEERLLLERGDTVVLFSDGVLDAKNHEGEPFTVKKMEEIIRGSKNSAERLISDIVKAIKRHTRKESQFDDITIMALKWH
ncbi:MAG TPA: GAF domain-containing SpoIIE family protein phosphatase [archaeon]|nr:GAF domain-containing SpoIIE family protein phosphatase [archaeon]